jgi:hypothetical protein
MLRADRGIADADHWQERRALTNAILTLFSTADSLLEATDVELERAVLLRVVEYCRDSMHPWTTRDNVSNELFERGAYEYDARNRNEVAKAVGRSWKRLEDGGLIEEPDPDNGKNGYRIPSKAGKEAADKVDFAAARIRGRFTREMFHHSLPDAAWQALRVGDHDTAVFEALKAVEIAIRKKGIGKNGIIDNDHGVELMRKAFDPDKGPLSDMNADRRRRVRRCELFTGAFGELRNPKAHNDPVIADPMVAVEEMMVASTLLRIVDSV